MLLDKYSFHIAQKPFSEGSGEDALARRLAELNSGLRHKTAEQVIETALREVSPISLVSSFGADSVTLLHLASMVDRDIPVIFIDTELLFRETLVYQQEIAEQLGLRNLRIVRANDIDRRDPDGTLHRRDPNACCALRKSRPLQKALEGSNGWITGRKRFQSDTRAGLPFFEVEPDTLRIKVNPLTHWTPRDVAEYIEENHLPKHPLIAQGYLSIGCMPCTTPVAPGEDPRAGRWRNSEKDECGIHFVNGKVVREGDTT